MAMMSETTAKKANAMSDPTENDRLRAERDALAQAIHDARGILGFDNDGDSEPHAGDYIQYAEFHRRDAAEARKDYDDALDEILTGAELAKHNAAIWLEGATWGYVHSDDLATAERNNPYRTA